MAIGIAIAICAWLLFWILLFFDIHHWKLTIAFYVQCLWKPKSINFEMYRIKFASKDDNIIIYSNNFIHNIIIVNQKL